MRNLLKSCGKSTIRFLVLHGFAWPIARICARKIKVLDAPRQSSAEGPVITALALSPDRFRGDLKVLAASGRVRVVLMPIEWQFHLRALFLPRETARSQVRLMPGEDWLDQQTQREFSEFLKVFLQSLFTMLSIDCVLSASFWYKQDRLLGEAANAIGRPYIVLHKENLRTERPQLEGDAEVARRIGKFGGSRIVLHNEVMRDVLVGCGFADNTQAVSLGCLRMDEFVRRLDADKRAPDTNRRPRVTYFSFSSGIGLKDLDIDPWSKHPFLGWNRLFELSHAEFARLALSRPDVDFVIKPKWGGEWIEKIYAALDANGLDLDEIPNLDIQLGGDVQQLMFDSDVICAFGSTTILEAGLMDKPIVIPHFEEVNRKPYSEHILLREHYDLYDIAETPQSFSKLIVERLGNSTIDEAITIKRRDAFEKWVSSTAADATEKYINLLASVTGKNRDIEKFDQI